LVRDEREMMAKKIILKKIKEHPLNWENQNSKQDKSRKYELNQR
jgi:hypothetical protein